MNLILTVIEIVSPVFVLAALGFGWVRLGFDYPLDFVTRLAMTLAVPCLIFTALMQSDIAPAALRTLSLATLAAYGLVTLATAALVRLLHLDVRTYLAPLIFGNTGNLGLPLALFAFGDNGLEYAVVVFAVMAICTFTFGIWVVSGGGSPLTTLRQPMVIATILGGLFLWQGWQTPPVVTQTLELVGQLAIPLMLITLGVAVAGLKPRGVGPAVLLSLAKAGICIAFAVLAGRAFGLEPVAYAVLVLQLATPVAVTSYLLAERYNTTPDEVAALVVVSTVLSVGVLPATLAVLL